MAVYFGFYNSINHDRCYDAMQMSAIFDGIINDGVFQNVGEHFAVTENSGLTINVGAGRAWFNHTWTWNDSILPLTIPTPDQVKPRIDTVVIEVNSASTVRANSIKIIPGIPDGTNPVPPTLESSDYIHQYPLADIAVAPVAKNITQAEITNRIGTSATPFVTGILQTISIDSLIAQWKSEWAQWCSNSDSTVKTEWREFKTETVNDRDTFVTNEKQAWSTGRSEFEAYVATQEAAVQNFIENTENTFNTADKIEYASRLVLSERYHEREDITFLASNWVTEEDGTTRTQVVHLAVKTYLNKNSNIRMYTCDEVINKFNVSDYLTQYSYISKAQVYFDGGVPSIKAYCYEDVPTVDLKVTIIGA